MKRLWILMLACLSLGAIEVAKASDVTSYFMDSAVARMEHNAAFAPDKGYLAVPAIGSVSISTYGNLSMGSILYPVDGSLLTIVDTRVTADMALAGLSKGENILGVTSRIGLLNTGWYGKNRKGFYSVDLNLRTSVSASLPYELFEFIKTAPDEATIPEININADSYVELALGYSFPLTKRIYVGARIKALAGLASGNVTMNQLNIKMAADEWSTDGGGVLTTDYLGYGGAVDFGIDYTIISDRLRLSASVNDIGFIKWGKKNNSRQSIEAGYTFTGAHVDENGSIDMDATFDLGDVEMTDLESERSMRWLQTSVNVGAELSVWKNRLSFGAIYAASLYDELTSHRISGVMTLKPWKWIALATSYSTGGSTSDAVGVALNIYLPVINIYCATDILLAKKTPKYYVPINQSAMNFNLGIAVPLGRKSIRGIDEWREGAE